MHRKWGGGGLTFDLQIGATSIIVRFSNGLRKYVEGERERDGVGGAIKKRGPNNSEKKKETRADNASDKGRPFLLDLPGAPRLTCVSSSMEYFYYYSGRVFLTTVREITITVLSFNLRERSPASISHIRNVYMRFARLIAAGRCSFFSFISKTFLNSGRFSLDALSLFYYKYIVALSLSLSL